MEAILPFVSRSKHKLAKIKEEREFWTNAATEFESFTNSHTIPVGCRVRIISLEQEGRIEYIYKGKYYIKRDGYASVIGIYQVDLINLSTGFEDFLEVKNWLLEQEEKKYNEILIDSALPDVLTKDRINIIEVLDIPVISKFGYKIITFIHAATLRSGRIKIPTDAIREKGYYEVEIDGHEIVSILKSNKYVFNQFTMK